jgi:hypothetical protein
MDATEHTPLLLPLAFDDEGDERVPFTLTAAAHRAVGDERAPRLTVVVDRSAAVDAPDAPDASDTRRAQARALLRSGMPVTTIAAALGVPDALVASWTGDVELRRRQRRGPAQRGVARRPGAGGSAEHGAGGSGAGSLMTVAPALPAVLDHTDPVQRGVLAGLVLALLEVDEDGLSLRHDRVEPVALLLDALRAALPLPDERVRVAVKVAADLAVDRTRAMVAERLGVAADRIVAGRWASAPSTDAFQVRLDVVDAAAARLVGTWLRELRPTEQVAERPTVPSPWSSVG